MPIVGFLPFSGAPPATYRSCPSLPSNPPWLFRETGECADCAPGAAPSPFRTHIRLCSVEEDRMADPQPPKLLDQVRQRLRAMHCNIRTEDACVGWIRRYILFHQKRHPKEMG